MFEHLQSLEPRQLFATNKFIETDLVSNQPSVAAHQDADLVNGWGIAVNPSLGSLWVSAADSGKSTIYDDQGNTVLTTVNVPGSPTGTLYNTKSAFTVSKSGKSGSSQVLFVTEEGTIAGWSISVDATHAITKVDQSAKGSSFKGLAINNKAGADARLFAANFGKSRVDVFDGSFHAVKLAGNFTDPKLPSGYAPFNIALIGKNLYVAYAKKQKGSIDEVDGAGLGVVDVFKTNGQFSKRLASGGTLNAPWAMVQAPDGFGSFGGDILVGNFGDGKINVFNPTTGKRVAALHNAQGHSVAIDGLWGLTFGRANTSNSDTLFFAAGPDDESNGLVGTLTASEDNPSGGIDY